MELPVKIIIDLLLVVQPLEGEPVTLPHAAQRRSWNPRSLKTRRGGGIEGAAY